jgi:hypothetical protein
MRARSFSRRPFLLSPSPYQDKSEREAADVFRTCTTLHSTKNRTATHKRAEMNHAECRRGVPGSLSCLLLTRACVN